MEQQQVKEKKSVKLVINIIIIVIITGFLLYFAFREDGIENIIFTLQTINQKWFLLGIAFIIGYWILEAMVLHIITTKVYKKQKFIDSLNVTMVGQLFNNLTPFSSGGQPMQAVTMVKNGISMSNNTPILLIKFIVYQMALIVYTTIVVIAKYSYFKNEISGFVQLSVIGFIVNCIVVIFLLLIGLKKDFIRKVIHFCIKLLAKIKIIKNTEQKIEKMDKSVENFHENFKIIRKEKRTIGISFVLCFLQITAFCSITYMIYRAFGYYSHSIFDIIAAQSFLMLIMAFVPTPGAGGAAEGGFFIMFKQFFDKSNITVAILLWRMITFYLPIIIGGVFMVISNKKKKTIL